MTTWALDIKTPDDFQRAVDKTAKSLDRVTKYEVKINKLVDKGASYAKRDVALGRQKHDVVKKEMGFADKLAKHYLMVRDAATAAFRVAKALTLDAIHGANEVEKKNKSLKFQVNAITAGTNLGEQYAMLEKFFGHNTELLKEAAQQFVKIREASGSIENKDWISNEMAGRMTKVYADIRGISGSSEDASAFVDKWLAAFKESPQTADRLLASLKASHREWADIGTGKFMIAPKSSAQSAEDKQKKFLADIADAIKPLTDLYNRLSGKLFDSLSKFVTSKEFKNFVKDLADSIDGMIKGFPKLINQVKAFVETWKTAAQEISATGFDWLDKIGAGFEKAFKLIVPIDDWKKAIEMWNKAQPPAPAKQGLLKEDYGGEKSIGGSKIERQLAGITIQNLNVQGGNANAEQIARSVRQEMQLLLQAGALSKGYA